jgi:putative transposase
MIIDGVLEFTSSDGRSEFIAKEPRWLSGAGVKIAYNEPGNLWENGFVKASLVHFDIIF